MNILNIPCHIYDQIMGTIGAAPTESGGIFSINRDNTITKYYFDVLAGTGNRFYRPSAPRITAQVNEWLQESGISFGGYIHSHPAGCTTLSPMDIVAAEMTMYRNGLPFIYMLLLCENRLYCYQLVSQSEQDHALMNPVTIRMST